jgi:CheY-like chemotaxis protein
MAPQPVAFQILVLDDDQEDRLLMQMELKDSGRPAELRFIENSDDLLALLQLIDANRDKNEPLLPDLILIDAFFQKLRQVVRWIRASESLRLAPVVVMLGSPNEEDYLKQYDLQVSGYVVKPVMCDWLDAIIHGSA